MTIEHLSHSDLSDDESLNEVRRLAGAERQATAHLVAVLAEIDARRLYLGQGCSSLFVYCTRVLRLSEHAAYGRIEAARASRRFPVVLEMLASGELTLTSLCLLAPHVTETNCRELLARARHRSKREVQEIVASVRPQPDVPDRVRKLPAQPLGSRIEEPALTSASTECRSVVATSTATVSRPAPRPIVQPLAPDRYKLQLTIGRETRDKLSRVQDLMRHSLPSGDLSAILDQALDLLLTDLERKKVAACRRGGDDREHPAPLSSAQSVRGGAVLR
jgi:hypothetical protein